MNVDYSKSAPWELTTASDITIVGKDVEMADYDNPQGFVYGLAYYITAEDAKGNRRVCTSHHCDSQDEVDAIMHCLDGWSPEEDDWIVTTPHYGSESYGSNNYQENEHHYIFD
jgi:hypothetical protein